jgi:hypothetical protein
VELVEALDLFFEGAELDEAGLHLLDARGVRTEVEAVGEGEELSDGFIGGGEVFGALLAEALRGYGVGAEEDVGLQRADAEHHGGADLARAADDGDAAVGNGGGELIGLIDAEVGGGGADEHGEDEHAGADAEL